MIKPEMLNGDAPLPPNYVIGKCSICRGTITYGTTRAIGVDGHGDTATLYHEDCKKIKISIDAHRKLGTLLVLSGSLRK